MSDAIGPTLNKYEILKPLSSGGMGAVYLAEDTSLRRKVAIKVLPPEWAGDPERFQRFQREARVLATLNHPNIVTIYSVEEDDGVHFLTMELVDGETLAQVIPSVGLSLDRIFEIAIPLADALSAAHEQGVIHRDLKPGNIMLDRAGRVKVLDFGLAKREKGIGESGTREPITRDGLMMGTVPYMAPEQLQGEKVDHRADIFSLGVVLFEMSTGRRPFDGKTWSDLASSILRDQPPSVTVLNVYLPRQLGRIVRHCLEKDPQRRFQTALDLRNELEELRREMQSGELPDTSSDLSSIIVKASAPRRQLEKALALAASVLVAAVVLAVVWFRVGATRPIDSAETADAAALYSAPAADPDGIGPGTRGPGAQSALEAGPQTRAANSGSLFPNLPAGIVEGVIETKRIVVLPLENLGPAEHEFFAAGITEEITSRLSAVSALHVISPTTARNYDFSGKSVAQIGRDLGIDYLLAGSVRWSTGADKVSRVRVTPRLVRVADDHNVWSDSYERVLDDIFEVQSDIAKEVIRQLDIAILEPEQRALASRPTQHIEAYQAYLRGMDYASGQPTQENMRQAVEMFERAAELDPRFALAFAELSEVHSQIYHSVIDRTDERLEMARNAAERALEIDPDLPAAHRALGYYHYWGRGDYDAALEEFAIAARDLPNDSQLIAGIAYIRRRQGRFEESIEQLRQALALDPQNADLATELAHTYTTTRQYELADRVYDRAITTAPNESAPYQLKALTYLLWKGSIADSRATLEVMPEQKKLGSVMAWFRLELFAGNYEAALELLETAAPLKLIGTPGGMFPRSLLRGEVFRLMGRAEDARLAYQSAGVVMERIARLRPDDPRVRSVLGQIYAVLGRNDEAVREGRRAVELSPIKADALKGGALLEQLAYIHALVDEPDAALDLLEQLLAMPAEISAPMLRLDPRWEPLRDHPRFIALLS